jgi:hypothetical protein
LEASDVAMPAAGEDHEQEGHGGDSVADMHEEGEETHTEIHVSLAFRCAKPETLRAIKIKLFETFAGFEEITVQWIINAKQGSETVIGANPEVTIR